MPLSYESDIAATSEEFCDAATSPTFLFLSHALPFTANAGSVIGAVAIAMLGAYSAFALLGRTDNQTALNARKTSLALLAAICFTLGSWTSQLTGLHVLSMSSSGDAVFPTFEPGFVALSLLVPLLVICIAFVTISSGSVAGTSTWLYALSGGFVGLSLGFMHYSLFFSLPFLNLDYPFVQTLLALLLGVFISTFASFSIAMFQMKWSCCIWIRIFFPFLYGCGLCGMNFLALDGVSFHVNTNVTIDQLNAGQHEWNVLTIAIPVVVAFLLASLIVSLTTVDLAKCRAVRSPGPKLTIASVSFTSDGRVLITDEGTLPTEDVDLDGLHRRDIFEELKPGGGIFHWLYSLSFDWMVVSPFVDRIVRMSSSSHHRRSGFPRRPTFSCIKPEEPPLSQACSLKIRLLEAVVRLSSQLDIPLSKLGYLYDQTMITGTQVNFSEFLHLTEKEPESRDMEKALSASAAGAHEGLMLFLVRRLPPTAATPDDDWARKYAPRGFRLAYLRRFRKTLADRAGAAQDDVDRILVGCQDYVENGTRPVVQPGGTYVSLLAVRAGAEGAQEVLVYEFAKHQMPSYRLDLGCFTAEMRAWLRNAAGITVAELLQACKSDVARQRARVRFSVSTKRTSCASERPGNTSMTDFEEALAVALEQFLAGMSFVPRLHRVARLSPQVLDVPSNQGLPAHLIVFKADLSDPTTHSAPPSNASHPNIAEGAALGVAFPAPPTMSSAFVYTPKALFDVAQTQIGQSASRFHEQAIRELERLYPHTPAPTPAPRFRRCTPYSNRCALVSTFSLDTVSDAGAPPRSLTQKCSFSSLRSWASSVATGLPQVTRKALSQPASPIRTMFPITEAGPALRSPPASLRRSRSHTYPAPGPGPSRHPYLHLRLPPPLVFAHHPFANASSASLESKARTSHSDDSVVFSGYYHLNSDMQRADAWFERA